ncbi:MAG: NADH-quinone oxidoreductase subunit C [Prolixibacteraceae bacterium]|jgi:NADH-quinone oxidoreductase subunit C|nr:NADH-quinone oxidoreductase subunit C [Prolixibacteraceae bacterium]
MKQQLIHDSLQKKFQNESILFDETSDILTFTVRKQSIVEVVQFLKEVLGFQFLTDLCGIHYPEQELALGVVYHLHNFQTNTRIRVKTFTSVQKPQIDTLTNLFSSANWMERETYDFFGIDFVGHPNLIRILNVEYLDYFPLRKEYPLEDQTRKDKDDRFFGR